MTKQCPQCNRELKLNETNFRKFNGSWRNKCRACQNEHKRKVYQLKKKRKDYMPRLSYGRQSSDFARKYNQIFALEDKIGILPDDIYLGLILSSRDKFKITNSILALNSQKTYKQLKKEKFNALLKQYHQNIKIIKITGLSVDDSADVVDKALRQHDQIKLTKTA